MGYLCFKILGKAKKKDGSFMEKNNFEETQENEDLRLPLCTYAPEWAEHARFNQENEPCDDGRAGNICGHRKGEESCPLS